MLLVCVQTMGCAVGQSVDYEQGNHVSVHGAHRIGFADANFRSGRLHSRY